MCSAITANSTVHQRSVLVSTTGTELRVLTPFPVLSSIRNGSWEYIYVQVFTCASVSFFSGAFCIAIAISAE